MVDRQLRKRGIRDPRVLDAMLAIPREEFVPHECRVCSYQDEPLQIGYGQTISQPYMIALMAELLELTGTETVLDVGGGSGYHAAVLGRLAARVISIEIIPALARLAEQNLARTGLGGNITVVCGDGSQGWPDGRALRRASRWPPPRRIFRSRCSTQLADPGRLVIPVGDRQRPGTARDRKVRRRRPRTHRHLLPLRALARRCAGWR